MAILSSKPEHPYQAILRVVHKVGDLEEGEYSPHALVPIKLLHPEVATSTQEEHLYVYKAVIGVTKSKCLDTSICLKFTDALEE